MAEGIVLQTGQSIVLDQVRGYFEFLFEAEASGDSFPVDFEKVWPMAYPVKSTAKRALVNSEFFLEGEDYIFNRNVENSRRSQVGRPKDEIHLSIRCFEFFAARKLRPIFEIYRQCRLAMTAAARILRRGRGETGGAAVSHATASGEFRPGSVGVLLDPSLMWSTTLRVLCGVVGYAAVKCWLTGIHARLAR